jgi:hypothetical protein
VKRIKHLERAQLREECKLAVDYLAGRQVNDVAQELETRFPATQAGGTGQEIEPLTINLTKRFVSEQATLYNKGVSRKLVDQSGQETDATKAQTLKLNRALDDANMDEVLHATERHTVLLEVCGLWIQEQRKKLRPVVTLPHLIYPIAPPPDTRIAQFNGSDPEDYAGFVVETEYDRDDTTRADGALYTLLDDVQGIVYQGGGSPDEPHEVIAKFEHGLGINPLTFWHTSLPTDELITHSDATIARANRELNLAWSVLMDTLRMQGFATPVKKVTNKKDPSARQLHGSRFPVILDITEDFSYASAAAPFSDAVAVIQEFLAQLALSYRENPEDFSSRGAQAISGFAKAVSSLPKIQARQERARRAQAVEQQQLGPRVIKVLVRTGQLDSEALGMRWRVAYESIEFPMTPQETQQRLDVDIKYGLTTPAQELANRKHITVEEAKKQIEENLVETKEIRASVQAPAPGQHEQRPQPGGYAERIAGRRRDASGLPLRRAP